MVDEKKAANGSNSTICHHAGQDSLNREILLIVHVGLIAVIPFPAQRTSGSPGRRADPDTPKRKIDGICQRAAGKCVSCLRRCAQSGLSVKKTAAR